MLNVTTPAHPPVALGSRLSRTRRALMAITASPMGTLR